MNSILLHAMFPTHPLFWAAALGFIVLSMFLVVRGVMSLIKSEQKLDYAVYGTILLLISTFLYVWISPALPMLPFGAAAGIIPYLAVADIFYRPYEKESFFMENLPFVLGGMLNILAIFGLVNIGGKIFKRLFGKKLP